MAKAFCLSTAETAVSRSDQGDLDWMQVNKRRAVPRKPRSDGKGKNGFNGNFSDMKPTWMALSSIHLAKKRGLGMTKLQLEAAVFIYLTLHAESGWSLTVPDSITIQGIPPFHNTNAGEAIGGVSLNGTFSVRLAD
ncbi:hypothetical protein EMCG_04523 [[Emmonsia] crescens]|uniref:Uncharacterized protein n=1 Tax=[Emmonsia] crescens TaxID=73230 RepID=A0A0G2J7C9_9EURO|nr:hypothetical protein EMCG_04523 [Emmonsia crescens UAMH 3008]